MTGPVEVSAFDQFRALTDLFQFKGAAYGFAAIERGALFENLACRLVLLEQSPSGDWETDGGVDELRLQRGWVELSGLQAFLIGEVPATLELGRVALNLSGTSATGYFWGVQDFYPNLVDEMGWPGVRLQGSSQHMYQLAGRENLRRLERRLAVAKCGPFTGWQGVGKFLAHSGHPLRIGDSESILVELFAPSPVRVVSAVFREDGELRVVIQARTDHFPEDLQLLVSDSEGDILRTLHAGDSLNNEGRASEFHLQLGARLGAVQLAVYVARNTVQRMQVIRQATSAKTALPVTSSRRESRRSLRQDITAESASAPITVEVVGRLHPMILERAGQQFALGHLDDAVSNAFKAVEVRLRDLAKLGLDELGTKLVDIALNPKSARLRVGQTSAEQLAAHQLFRGALGWFKNPRSHRFPELDDEVEALEALALASQLLRILDAATVVKPADAATDDTIA